MLSDYYHATTVLTQTDPSLTLIRQNTKYQLTSTATNSNIHFAVMVFRLKEAIANKDNKLIE